MYRVVSWVPWVVYGVIRHGGAAGSRKRKLKIENRDEMNGEIDLREQQQQHKHQQQGPSENGLDTTRHFTRKAATRQARQAGQAFSGGGKR